jgi:hypothetical protein
MRSRVQRSLTVFTLLSLTLFSTFWFTTGVYSQRGQQQAKDADNLADLLKRKTLREVALERDVEIISHPELAEYNDLHSLARGADTIVVGRITHAESSFDESDNNIDTTYSVDVQRVLKATPPITSPLNFVGFGGVVHVNGHRASTRVKGFDLLKTGKDYILFLEWRPKRQSYILAGGMSGAFLIEDHSLIRVLASSQKSRLKHQYNDMELESFILEVLKHL